MRVCRLFDGSCVFKDLAAGRDVLPSPHKRARLSSHRYCVGHLGAVVHLERKSRQDQPLAEARLNGHARVGGCGEFRQACGERTQHSSRRRVGDLHVAIDPSPVSILEKTRTLSVTGMRACTAPGPTARAAMASCAATATGTSTEWANSSRRHRTRPPAAGPPRRSQCCAVSPSSARRRRA